VPKCVTNKDDFERDILCRTIFVFYEGQFPTAKSLTYIRDKIYSESVINVSLAENYWFEAQKHQLW
jgi:hypothetical protein